ncbi:hypothetical protein CY0110_12427 [Crocosphaera chwakensis CCY0110]|uniref:Uncharacterized protein n=1 Tax=Crocosphaera chwakensis CCY0110 TaxID=391612 RepID=A3IXX3_9CHRO|nr:hypothetical protein CY0110_12427 [Crocosphaera chwakensis CCY0110]
MLVLISRTYHHRYDCHDIKTRKDLKHIKSYKSQKVWNKTQKEFNSHFERSKWEWTNGLPTLVNGTHNKSLFTEEPDDAKSVKYGS